MRKIKTRRAAIFIIHGMELNFRSDNESPAAPAIMAALQEANQGRAWAYGEDAWSAKLDAAFSEIGFFEKRPF